MAETRKLEGKVALVTGAAQGLGEAILKEFALEGAKTIIFDIDANESNRVREELRKTNNDTEVVIIDVCNSDDVNIAISNLYKNIKKLIFS